VRGFKILITGLFVISTIGWVSHQSLAYPPFVAKAKRFGAKDCTFCHVAPEGGPPWNARGNWLIKEKEKRGADAVDVDWLAEYKSGEAGKDTAKTEAPKSADSTGSVEQQLLKLEREWLDAYTNRNSSAMERIEADDFTIVYPNGSVLTKADELAGLRTPAPEGPRPTLSTEGTKVRVYGNTAILTGVVIQKGTYLSGPEKGKLFEMRSRYTDVYVNRSGQWQVVSSQLTNVQQPLQTSRSEPLIRVDRSKLAAYVGQYELPMFVLTVTLEDDRLFGQPPGDEKKELLPLSETEFVVATPGQSTGQNDVRIKLTFMKDSAGAVTALKAEVAGQTMEGKKIK